MMFQSFKAKTTPRPVASFQIFKELSALIAEYICIISRLFSASSANLNFDKIKRPSENSDGLFIGQLKIIC